MRKNAKENIIVVCTIVLCFMLTLALCLVLSGEGLLSVFKNDKSEKCTFYAVATGGYSDITLARNNAELVKQRGGAGYVIAGDSIELILPCIRVKTRQIPHCRHLETEARISKNRD